MYLFFKNSVSEDLLCAFELLKPLDGAALRKEMTKAKRKRSVQRKSSKVKTNILRQCNGYCVMNLDRVKTGAGCCFTLTCRRVLCAMHCLRRASELYPLAVSSWRSV